MSNRCCQAQGCNEDLVALGKPYFIKKKICERHMRAEQLHKTGCGDSLWRFCQQCGRLEPLINFDGTKRNCRASLSRRKLQPELLSLSSGTSSIRPRKAGSDQCSKQQQPQKQQRKQMSCTVATEAVSVTEDDTMQGVELGFAAGVEAATTGTWTAEAATECQRDSSFATHPGACVTADRRGNAMTLDQAYAQIQQQQLQQLQQQQLMLEQQLHSAMTMCADTAEHYGAFGVSTHQAAEGSTSASPMALPANLGVFGRLNSVMSVSSSADEAMQAHVENIMMAELVAELCKTKQQQQQQQKQALQQSLLQQQQQQQQQSSMQHQQHAALGALAPAAPCDAGSSNLPTLQLLAQPTLPHHHRHHHHHQQQQALLASSYQQQQQQHGYLAPHMSGGYPRAAAAPAAGLMHSAATAGAVGCFSAPVAAPSAAPVAAALNFNAQPAGVGLMMGQAKTRDPAMAGRLQALTTQMAQMQAMLLQLQQSLDIAKKQ